MRNQKRKLGLAGKGGDKETEIEMKRLKERPGPKD